MRKIIDELSGVMLVVIVVVALVGVVYWFFPGNGTGVVEEAFQEVIEGFGDKVDEATGDSGGDGGSPDVVEPVAYLYNGTVLPALPEWDKETYPYAYLVTAMGHALVLSQQPLVTNGLGSMAALRTNEKTDIFVINTYYENGSYHFYSEGTLGEREANESVYDGDIFWTNTDLYDMDSNLYLSATDPVPVYE